ncbi:DUF4142 domain-containing protein [Lentzea sp. NPDC051213]|uniref:DUF4142 domain-containing protein n=1 Tax=Lentzea sp. NPDC051213 TaxID=3364126 RepID=UPI003794DC26
MSVRGTATFVLIGILGLAFLPIAVADTAGREQVVDASLPSGPLTAADRELLMKVRQAGLWEGPISTQMVNRTTNPKVKAPAQQLAHEHHELDALTLKVAAELSIGLPDQATPQQQGWVSQILSAPPDQADSLYANLARAAHGSSYITVAKVRSSTQNDVIRAYAQTAMDYTGRHMQLLESTGLVDSSSLLVPNTGPAAATSENTLSTGAVILGIAIAGLVSVGTLGMVRVTGSYSNKPQSNRPQNA